MKGKYLFLIALLLFLTSSLPVVSQSGGDYELGWWTVDSGGHTFSTGGGYQLGGTIGQSDAGLLTGGGFTLGGGFWRGGAVVSPPCHIYLPLVVRQSP
jgi:hypothetical protein